MENIYIALLIVIGSQLILALFFLFKKYCIDKDRISTKDSIEDNTKSWITSPRSGYQTYSKITGIKNIQ